MPWHFKEKKMETKTKKMIILKMMLLVSLLIVMTFSFASCGGGGAKTGGGERESSAPAEEVAPVEDNGPSRNSDGSFEVNNKSFKDFDIEVWEDIIPPGRNLPSDEISGHEEEYGEWDASFTYGVKENNPMSWIEFQLEEGHQDDLTEIDEEGFIYGSGYLYTGDLEVTCVITDGNSYSRLLLSTTEEFLTQEEGKNLLLEVIKHLQ
jgi:hypothetical protein